jgi:hypothetical protein
MPPENQN